MSTPTPTGPTTTTPTPEAAVEAGFDAAAEAYVLASATADPEHPELLATHTGVMLERRQQQGMGADLHLGLL